MADYDISKAFKVIEDDLIGSMIRNLDHHRAMETDEGIQWTQWQVQQLKMLERYKQTNAKKFGKQFNSINNQIANVLTQMQEKGGFEQEQHILKAIQNGFKRYKHLADGSIQGEFFGINDNKLQALINATTNDMQKAETAVLRLADDQYRKAIFNAQIYAQTGGTYAKAVDMATKDMLRAGLNCVEYKNGARHTLSSYAEMALRTAGTRAYLQGEGEKRKEWGIHTVILNQRTCPCPLCFPFVGKVFVDDVWSGGTQEEAQELGYPLLSEAIAEGLYHPNCKDIHTTYFEGITSKNKPTASEKQKAIEEHSQQQKANYSQNQAEKYHRMSTYSLDEDNKRIYKARANEWEEKADSFKIYYVAKSIANSGESGIIKVELNKNETEALTSYISSESYKINEKLRSSVPLTEDEKRIADDLDKALQKMPKYDGTVYRSLDSSVMENPAEFWRIHQPGSVVGYRAFTSTSLNVYDEKMDIQCVIQSKTGRNITSFNDNEKEILFRRDSLFRVARIDGNTIYMEEWG